MSTVQDRPRWAPSPLGSWVLVRTQMIAAGTALFKLSSRIQGDTAAHAWVPGQAREDGGASFGLSLRFKTVQGLWVKSDVGPSPLDLHGDRQQFRLGIG